MAFTIFSLIFFYFFSFNFENKALGSFQSDFGVYFQVCQDAFQRELWFNGECTRVNLMRRQVNHGALSVEPQLTFK